MESCKKINEKLIFFDDLSREEKREVQAHVDQCTSCLKKLRDYQGILSAISSGDAHPVNDELLTRYSVYLVSPREADYDGKKLSRSEIKRIRQHAVECQACEKKIERLTNEYREIQAYLETTDLPDLTLNASPKLETSLGKVADKLGNLAAAIVQGLKDLVAVPTPKWYPAAVGVLAAFFIMIWMGPFFRGGENPYLHLVSVDKESASFLTRSGLSETLADGLAAFNRGDNEQAIASLEKFVQDNPNDPSLFYAHYILGIAYLNEAQSDFLGRFHKVDPDFVETGRAHLERAQNLTENASIAENCQWYLGMAYLLQGDVANARANFQRVVELRGRRFKEAKEMLAEIARLN